MTDWNPTQYLAFADERARPALDLIARIPNRAPKLAHDLGCGPGNSTALLAAAFPKAKLTGIDASYAMIAKAKAEVPRASFVVGDVAQWQPHPDADVVFSNALFQWVPEHGRHLTRILAVMKQGAVLAVQMPDNLGEPSHMQMAKVAARSACSGKLAQASAARSPLLTVQGYFQLLRSMAATVEIWSTIYYHRMNGVQGIIEMFMSTGLKPYLDPLTVAERKQFLADYSKAITPSYPTMEDGTLLYPFPRLFILAVK
jgi:trans-aconitate 2-methyltransferase